MAMTDQASGVIDHGITEATPKTAAENGGITHADRAVIILMLSLSLIFATMAVVNYVQDRHQQQEALEGQIINASPNEVIGTNPVLDYKKLIFYDKSKAMQVIKSDMKQANVLGLDSTPTFLLCQPDGTVLELNNANFINTIQEKIGKK